MLRTAVLAAAAFFVSGAAFGQSTPAPSSAPTERRAAKKSAAAAAPEAPARAGETAAPAAAKAETTPAPRLNAVDQEEFRRQVMEEVRRELAKAREEVKQETAWVAQDSQARVQDSEAVDQLKQRVNLFQPHGYIRARGEFFNNLRLGRGPDSAGYTLFPSPLIGPSSGNDTSPSSVNNSVSDVNFRFRFEPTLAISEDLAIYSQLDVLDNILLGSDPSTDKYISPFTPISALSNTRAAETIRVKRAWGRVNTQLGELLFGRMGYHWGLGILHNDGNCLDCDFGDTYDRLAFAPREFKGHHFGLMFDLLDKGQGTTGEKGELGRSVDLDTLDDGYRLGIEVTKLDTAEEAKRKLDAGGWVINYGLVADYRTQTWDSGVAGATGRAALVRRNAKIYQPDGFLSIKHRRWRLDAELALALGSIGSAAPRDVVAAGVDPSSPAALAAAQQINIFQTGFALQTDWAVGNADAVFVGVEFGGASGDKGAYGFGARQFRSGSGNVQPFANTGIPGASDSFRSTGPGDIDGSHIDLSGQGPTHARINNFVFNRAYNVDMILWRNLVTSVTSGWYLKPSVRFRPTGRKSAGGDDTGFELVGSIIYSQAWYSENTPGLSRALGLETDIGINYDTTDRLHLGVAYGLLIPFSGLRNTALDLSPSIAHAAKFIVAIPF